MFNNKLRNTAHKYLDAGLCVLPASGVEKYPIGINWNNYSDKGITKDRIKEFYEQNASSNDDKTNYIQQIADTIKLRNDTEDRGLFNELF